MRATVLSVLLLAAGCGGTRSAVGDAGSHDLGARAPDAGAPDLASAGPVTTVLRVHYPAGAHTLAVRGADAPWNWSQGAPMQPGPDDTWTLSTTALAAPTEWKPLLDDSTWSMGANFRVTPGATVDVWPHFTATNGQVVKLIPTFHSTVLNNDRTVWAYLPPSYTENTRASYPVIYMHDGQNLFDPALAFGGNDWMVEQTLDAGAGTQDPTMGIREVIVIGPENTAQRIYEYTPTTDPSTPGGGGGDLYLKMLIDELKPVVDGMLRTLPGRATTGILGSSLGGLISAYAGVTHADVYGLVGAMSPSTWWNNDVIVADVKGSMPPRPLRVYVDSGDSGTDNDDVADTNVLAQTWLDLGYQEGVDFHHVVQAGGQHNEIYWAQRLPGALRFLVGGQQY